MNKFLLTFFIIVFLFKTGNVISNSDIFDVDNITVTSNDISTQNREKLLNSAFKKGFQKLIKKILLNKDVENILKTNIKEIKYLVSSYQIHSQEQNDNLRKLIINMSFDKKRINSFFYKKNISYSDTPKTKALLIPVVIKNDSFYLYSKNIYFEKWNIISEEEDEFIDYILPIENIEDVMFLRNNINNLATADIKNLTSKYDIENHILLLIEPEKKNNNIFIKTFLSDKNINKNFNIIIDEKNIEKTIIKIKDEINEIWKSQNLIDVRTPSFLNIKVEIKKINDLLSLQKSLEKIDIIENFSVVELNNEYANVKIKYFGKIEKLKRKFILKGVKMKNINNQWSLELI
ncbi:MAG: hypothetical protein FD547_000165 [Pelagibacterales bacterium]|jgi:hypothetical protein|nr:hypothetical protein [Pelagibacterales bacterium]